MVAFAKAKAYALELCNVDKRPALVASSLRKMRVDTALLKIGLNDEVVGNTIEKVAGMTTIQGLKEATAPMVAKMKNANGRKELAEEARHQAQQWTELARSKLRRKRSRAENTELV